MRMLLIWLQQNVLSHEVRPVEVVLHAVPACCLSADSYHGELSLWKKDGLASSRYVVEFEMHVYARVLKE